MFRMKRFRLSLFLAIVTIITLYEFRDLWLLTGPSSPSDEIKVANALVPTRSTPVQPTPPISASSTPLLQDDTDVITGEELLVQKPNYEDEVEQHGQGRLEVKARPSGKPRPRWLKPKEHFPVKKLITLPTAQAKPRSNIQYSFRSESSRAKTERLKKQAAIREAFIHAWGGYKHYAYGHDELRPLSNTSADPFNGWGATLVDSLDTLWLMGLADDFEDAVRMVGRIDFKTSARKDIPLFETTIRYLGGLLAAYDVSGKKHRVLLDKAVELADILLGAFDTPNRMPIPYYNWAPSYSSQPHRASAHIVMAEIGSLAMEFTRLSQLTREHKYYDAIARVTDALEAWQMETTYPGVWPIKLDASGCQKPEVDKVAAGGTFGSEAVLDASKEPSEPDTNFAKRQLEFSNEVSRGPNVSRATGLDTIENPKALPVMSEDVSALSDDDDDQFDVDCDSQGLNIEPHSKSQMYSIAAMADSTYEYFPKMHALLGGLNEQYKSMYEKSMAVIRSDFLFRPMVKDNRDVLFLAKQKMSPKAKKPADRQKTIYEGSHLGCFAGGMFALGSKVFDIPSDMKLAEKLTDGCVWAYDSTPLGLMPELFELVPCEVGTSCRWNESRWHEFLDPLQKERFEAVEQYNKKQEALLDDTEDENEPRDAEIDPPRPDVTKRQAGADSEAPTPTTYRPKIALSHAKYVAARIEEERLPPGYVSIESPAYKLRPEAIESVFVMYRLTGDQQWREKGWKMFMAAEKATRTLSGHATVKDVTSSLEKLSDTMESFWLAETLKYYYLLFSEETIYSLDEWVLNTEAHGFRLP